MSGGTAQATADAATPASIALASSEIIDQIVLLLVDGSRAAGLIHLNMGYRRFLGGVDLSVAPPVVHHWSFLRPWATIDLWPSASSTADGAPAKDNGTSTVTVDDAIFFCSMVGYNVTFAATENTYPIASYTSAKVVVVTGDASGEADEDTVSVVADGIYRLPTTYGGLINTPIYIPLSGYSSPEIIMCTPEEIARRHRDSTATGTSKYISIVKAAADYDLYVHPIVAVARELKYRFKARQDALTDSSSEYPLGSDLHSNTLLEAALAAAEAQSAGIVNGTHEQLYRLYMAESIQTDQIQQGIVAPSLANAPTGMGR